MSSFVFQLCFKKAAFLVISLTAAVFSRQPHLINVLKNLKTFAARVPPKYRGSIEKALRTEGFLSFLPLGYAWIRQFTNAGF
jgi:hypothetical protein